MVNKLRKDMLMDWFNREKMVILVFILNIVIVFPIFFPNLSEIGDFDPAEYINFGRKLAEGIAIPKLSFSPLSAILHAITYIPVKSSPYWLIHSCTIGRFILFSLLWWGAYFIAKQMSSLSQPLVIITLLLISPVLTNLVGNSSDALFTAMSAFAFWQILTFYNTQKIRHLWMSSTFVALAAMSRNEGLILFSSLIFLSILIGISIKRLIHPLIASLVPFTVIVGGYLLLYGLVVGHFNIGTVGRIYAAFEQGHGIVYRHLYLKNPGVDAWPHTPSYYTRQPLVEAHIESRRLYGTPEENEYSIINAIRRNPDAFLERLALTTKDVPKLFFYSYGSGLGLVLFLLALRGLIEISRRKLYLLLCTILLWPVYLLFSFVIAVDPRYFLYQYFILFFLASIGLNSMLSNFESRKERYFWSVALSGLTILGILRLNPVLFVTSLTFLLGLWIIWIIMRQYTNYETIKLISLVTALCVIFVIGVGYRGGNFQPRFRTLGIAPEEKAVLFMRENLKLGARIGTYAFRDIAAAKMSYVPMWLNLRYMTSDQDLLSWIDEKNLEAIYVEDYLRDFEPSVWELVKQQIGKKLKVAFTSTDGRIQVLLVTRNP